MTFRPIFYMGITGALIFSCACGAPNNFKSRYKPTVNGLVWYGPYPADYSAYTVGEVGYANDASYVDFDFAQTPTKAVYTAAVYNADNSARVMSLQYEPYGRTSNIGGWSSDNTKSGLIDVNGSGSWLDAAVAMDYLGNYLSVFWDVAAATPRSVLRLFSEQGFGAPATVSPLVGALEKPQDDYATSEPVRILPRTKSVFFDRYYAAYPPDVTTYTPTGYVFFDNRTGAGPYVHNLKYVTYTTNAGWNSTVNDVYGVGPSINTIGSSTSENPEIKALGDGLGTTFLWIDDTAGQGKIYSRWLVNGSMSPDNASNPDTVSDSTSTTAPIGLDADSDGEGNVLSVFYQQKSSLAAATCKVNYATNCKIRLYANIRNSSGQWAGPAQIDTSSEFGEEIKTTHYQPSLVADSATSPTGGVNYARPVVAYVGNKRFIAAFAMNDVTSLSKRKSGLFVRGYTVGKGWDEDVTTLTTANLVNNGDPTDGGNTAYNAYRITNTISLSSDRNGNAVLVAQVVSSASTSNAAYSTREFNYKAFVLTGVTETSNGTWSAGEKDVFEGIPPCKAYYDDYPRCQNLTAKAAVFASGEATIVVPAPKEVGSEDEIRLYNFIYR